jgi:hypothetical protein
MLSSPMAKAMLPGIAAIVVKNRMGSSRTASKRGRRGSEPEDAVRGQLPAIGSGKPGRAYACLSHSFRMRAISTGVPLNPSRVDRTGSALACP